MMNSINQPNTLSKLNDIRQEVAEGLLYAHSRLNTNTGKTLEAASFLYALVELLSEKGVISVEELDGRKKIVARCFERSGS